MLTKFSKWLLYVASYLPIYIMLIIRLLFLQRENGESPLQVLISNFMQYYYVIIALGILSLISLLVFTRINHIKANERIHNKLTKNCSGEMASFFIPFILTLLTVGIDWYGWLICVFIFLLAGFIILQADWLRICPVFFYLGYSLYQTDNGTYVLSHLGIEQFNQLLLDDSTGIEVKTLTPKLCIVAKTKN